MIIISSFYTTEAVLDTFRGSRVVSNTYIDTTYQQSASALETYSADTTYPYFSTASSSLDATGSQSMTTNQQTLVGEYSYSSSFYAGTTSTNSEHYQTLSASFQFGDGTWSAESSWERVDTGWVTTETANWHGSEWSYSMAIGDVVRDVYNWLGNTYSDGWEGAYGSIYGLPPGAWYGNGGAVIPCMPPGWDYSDFRSFTFGATSSIVDSSSSSESYTTHYGGGPFGPPYYTTTESRGTHYYTYSSTGSGSTEATWYTSGQTTTDIPTITFVTPVYSTTDTWTTDISYIRTTTEETNIITCPSLSTQSFTSSQNSTSTYSSYKYVTYGTTTTALSTASYVDSTTYDLTTVFYNDVTGSYELSDMVYPVVVADTIYIAEQKDNGVFASFSNDEFVPITFLSGSSSASIPWNSNYSFYPVLDTSEENTSTYTRIANLSLNSFPIETLADFNIFPFSTFTTETYPIDTYIGDSTIQARPNNADVTESFSNTYPCARSYNSSSDYEDSYHGWSWTVTTSRSDDSISWISGSGQQNNYNSFIKNAMPNIGGSFYTSNSPDYFAMQISAAINGSFNMPSHQITDGNIFPQVGSFTAIVTNGGSQYIATITGGDSGIYSSYWAESSSTNSGSFSIQTAYSYSHGVVFVYDVIGGKILPQDGLYTHLAYEGVANITTANEHGTGEYTTSNSDNYSYSAYAEEISVISNIPLVSGVGYSYYSAPME
jgi:hypothetical protein